MSTIKIIRPKCRIIQTAAKSHHNTSGTGSNKNVSGTTLLRTANWKDEKIEFFQDLDFPIK